MKMMTLLFIKTIKVGTFDIENKNDNAIIIRFTDYDEILEIKDWVGLFSDQEYMIKDILNGKYEIIVQK